MDVSELTDDDLKILKSVSGLGKLGHPASVEMFTQAQPLLARGFIVDLGDSILEVPNEVKLNLFALGIIL